MYVCMIMNSSSLIFYLAKQVEMWQNAWYWPKDSLSETRTKSKCQRHMEWQTQEVIMSNINKTRRNVDNLMVLTWNGLQELYQTDKDILGCVLERKLHFNITKWVGKQQNVLIQNVPSEAVLANDKVGWDIELKKVIFSENNITSRVAVKFIHIDSKWHFLIKD